MVCGDHPISRHEEEVMIDEIRFIRKNTVFFTEIVLIAMGVMEVLGEVFHSPINNDNFSIVDGR